MQLFDKVKHLNSRSKQDATADLPELLARCKIGDSKAQKAVYELIADKMYALCLRYMGDRESAKDCLQDGFVSLFTKLDSYTGEGSFEGWARKIFVNTALMCLRKKDTLRMSSPLENARELDNGDPTIIENISYQDIMKKVAALPPGFRTVFNMYVVEGYSHKEIGEALGISENTSRSQLQRARLLLQSSLKRH